MSKLIVFDADSIVFTVAWSFRTKKVDNLVKIKTNKFITDVLTNSGADDYIGFYASKEESTKPNFRYAIDPKYKANRPPTPDFVIKWGPTIRNEFSKKWNFIPVDGIESDDAVAIVANHYKNDYDEIIIATFDKDLKQIPNTTFYNMKDHTMLDISELDAARNFYTQLIMGDSTDNIKGIPGMGRVAAKKLLKDCDTEYAMFRKVVITYSEFENKLKEKILTAEYKKITEEIKDPDYTGEYLGMSGAKLKRKIRINTKPLIDSTIAETIPGGWKSYYKMQYSLLHMLTEAPDDFTMPTAIYSPVKDMLNDNKDKTTHIVASVKVDELDDFLTI